MVKEKDWTKFPKENNFLGVPLSELQFLSSVPVHAVSASDRTKGGYTEGNEIYLNNKVDLQCIRKEVSNRLRKHNDGDKTLEYFSKSICSNRDCAYFIFLHELAHLKLKHLQQKAEIVRLWDLLDLDECRLKVNEKLHQAQIS